MRFDTTFFIDLEREVTAGQPGPAATFLAAHGGQGKHGTTVNVGEFEIGARSMVAVRKLFRGCWPMALGREDAIDAGQLQARLAFEMGENDLWIAGIALRHGLPLVTRDVAFSRVPGLRVVSY